MDTGPAPESQRAEARGRIFYGWYIVGAVFVIHTVSCGLIFYNLSIFLKAFVAEGGFTVSATSNATALFFISSGFAGLAVGWMLDRFDPRWVVTFGAFLSAGVLASAGHVGELWQLYAFYILFGIGNAAVAVIPGMTIVARWFTRQRSKAIAYASTGLSLGGILFTPLSATLVERYGLGEAAYWLALVLVLGVVPIALIMLRKSPEAIGLSPDGDPPQRQADGSLVPPDGVGFSEAIRSRFFILCTGAFVFSMMAQVGSLAHQFRLVATRTGDDHVAALAVSIMAASSIAGRLVGGSLLSRIASKNYLYAIYVLQGISFCAFAFADGMVALFIVSAMFGATVGNMQMMQPLIMAEAFGLKAYARILSLAQMITTCANAAGPALLGFLYATAGGYQTAYLVITLSSVLGFACLYAAGPVRALLDAQERPLPR
ncbi:MAG: MFS transporter [Parvibaculum sp.]|jgi:MFS family permease|uniref:MFS transporter n=1 Tax=Parvibaculum sp. TaxID=2024848 RepID=UPI000C5CD444|nr:MFS transporter [Parvibaculum sp.]MAU60312.1 MFS transporter [Parvibaculum sp.]HAC57697.1 MFS transporter [Rhodobiaceae bacterium]|tara:strand:- start:2045 stop:3337 length:1293 start_codon:yes stop_codon:yes gene_type:complete